MGRHVTKSIYVPGDPKGKGIVAIAFDPDDPAHKTLLDGISTLSSADLRSFLGIRDFDDLEKLCAGRSKSEALRERLALLAERKPKQLADAAREVIRATPAGTEDSPARVRRHIEELVEPEVRAPWRVLDPFAGTCNFPLVAVEKRPDARAWYCEADPVVRLWARLKIDIASRSSEARNLLDVQLAELAARIPSLVRHVAGEGSESAGPRIAAMEASLDALVGGRRGATGDARLAAALPGPLRATLIAARRVADELLDESPLLGRCLELSLAAAAARAARSTGRRASTVAPAKAFDWLGFVEHLTDALVDLKLTWLAPIEPATAPSLLCADARDLSQFPDLGVNVVLTSLTAFAVAEAVDPGRRVEHWMLRLADPSGRGKGLGRELRDALETLHQRAEATAGRRGGRRAEGSAFADPSRLSSAELRVLRDEGFAPAEASSLTQGLARSKTLAATLEEMSNRGGTANADDAALFARAGTALLRYVATIGDVFGTVIGSRHTSKKGVALIEIPNSQVRDLEIDTPAIVDEYLRALGARPLFNRNRKPRIVESSAPAAGRGRHAREMRTELLAYRF